MNFLLFFDQFASSSFSKNTCCTCYPLLSFFTFCNFWFRCLCTFPSCVLLFLLFLSLSLRLCFLCSLYLLVFFSVTICLSSFCFCWFVHYHYHTLLIKSFILLSRTFIDFAPVFLMIVSTFSFYLSVFPIHTFPVFFFFFGHISNFTLTPIM